MGDNPETKQQDNTAPHGGIDWGAQPPSLTTREVAALLGKSPGNVRARASKGDFGPTATGSDGLPRYDRDRVRVIGERMAARQAQAATLSALTAPPELPLAALLNALQVQQGEQVALYKAWVEEARETARLAKEEAKELRAVLHDREETTRETLSHMDMLHEQRVAEMKAALARERAQWEREFAAKDAEIERLKIPAAPAKNWAPLRRK